MNKNYKEWILKNRWRRYYYQGDAVLTFLGFILFVIISIINYKINNTIYDLINTITCILISIFLLTVSIYCYATYNIMNRCSKIYEQNKSREPYKPDKTKDNK